MEMGPPATHKMAYFSFKCKTLDYIVTNPRYAFPASPQEYMHVIACTPSSSLPLVSTPSFIVFHSTSLELVHLSIPWQGNLLPLISWLISLLIGRLSTTLCPIVDTFPRFHVIACSPSSSLPSVITRSCIVFHSMSM